MLGTILAGDRIRLRAPALEDLSTFTRWFADPDVTRYLLRRHPPSPAQEAGWFESRATSEKDLVWAVVLKEGELVIGVIGLHRIDWQHRHAWIEIVLGERSAWGKGYATEGMRLGTDHAFHELGLEKVLASVYSGNERSFRGEILREERSGPDTHGSTR